jgi:hypothetical protein
LQGRGPDQTEGSRTNLTLDKQYHLIWLLSRGGSQLFLYLALDRERANLVLARHNLRRMERDLSI